MPQVADGVFPVGWVGVRSDVPGYSGEGCRFVPGGKPCPVSLDVAPAALLAVGLPEGLEVGIRGFRLAIHGRLRDVDGVRVAVRRYVLQLGDANVKVLLSILPGLYLVLGNV